mgnify:FL=1
MVKRPPSKTYSYMKAHNIAKKHTDYTAFDPACLRTKIFPSLDCNYLSNTISSDS